MEKWIYYSVVDATMLKQIALKLRSEFEEQTNVYGDESSLASRIRALKNLNGKELFPNMYPEHASRIARSVGLDSLTVGELIWKGPFIEVGDQNG